MFTAFLENKNTLLIDSEIVYGTSSIKKNIQDMKPYKQRNCRGDSNLKFMSFPATTNTNTSVPGRIS